MQTAILCGGEGTRIGGNAPWKIWSFCSENQDKGDYMPGQNEKIGGGGFHHISMRVQDLDTSVRFYTKGLGFKLRLAWGPADNQTVLLDTGDGNYLELSAGESDGFNPAGLVRHFALRTDNCEKAIEAARAVGAEITVEPKAVVLSSNPPTPVRVAFCKGPDGEIIEFFEDETT